MFETGPNKRVQRRPRIEFLNVALVVGAAPLTHSVRQQHKNWKRIKYECS